MVGFRSELTCMQVIGFATGIIKIRVWGCIQMLRPHSAYSCTETSVVVRVKLCLLLLLSRSVR